LKSCRSAGGTDNVVAIDLERDFDHRNLITLPPEEIGE